MKEIGIECPICLVEINNIHTTICNHKFCQICIKNWLKTRNECPMCRFVIKEIISCNHQTEIYKILINNFRILMSLPM